MAIPKYPEILTTKSWSKAKGLMAANIETKIGDDLKVAEADYKRIDWAKFSPRDALARGSSLQQISLALQSADLEYKTKVQNLINVLGRIEKKADRAQTTFKAKKVSSKLIEHTAKLEAATKLFSAQLQMTRGELDEFKRIASNPTVEATIGTKWYDLIEKMNWQNSGALTAWITNKDLSISPANGKRNAELAAIQANFGKELAVFKKTIASIKAMKERRMELQVAKKLIIKTWREASDAFLVMKPGMMALQREWGVTFTQLAGSKEKAEAWKKQYPVAHALNTRVERLLFDAEPFINALDEATDDLAVSK